MSLRSLIRPSSAALSTLLAVGLFACSAQTEKAEATESDIIGGVEIRSPKFDAVGSLQAEINGGKQSICTGTLISPNVVLTAKHCAIAIQAADAPDHKDHYFTELVPMYFAIGNDAAAPKKLVRATSAIGSSLNEGGAGFGADSAVYFLSEPINDVTPLPVSRAPLSDADVGQTFFAMGYGVMDAAGTAGHRTMGNITLTMRDGKVFEAAYGTYEAFKQSIEARIGRPLTAEEDAQVHESFDQTTLLSDYEAFFGAKEGDVQPCSGDSGGPLLRKVDGQITVFGVASWVPNKEQATALCSRGIVYSTMGPAGASLLDLTKCGAESVAGRCDGTTAIRCLTNEEGGVRVTRTSCEQLDLTCGMVAGKAGCVEPAPVAPPASNQ